ncbi:helix-turn-helix domain-containing protein [Tamlana haliotis]|uniref:Helix-turn-helix domain-containing protein n=1 Tax=Pseudotamlana haliotis TaxID=2614804 RepID=A0A6N6MF38_9FLAO|nr:helix-turn-helix domain-containing protein [Tamlana haliotis]KAB1067954.1 helix-turn-helix domain-containing protein [Tamlana haliotis]
MKNFQGFGLSVEDLQVMITEAVASELRKVRDLVSSSQTVEKDLLTRDEACRFLDISYTTIWEYGKKDLIKPKKLGGRVYYSKSELLNLLNDVA